MRKIIHNLRKQPEEVRRTVLHAATLFCALVLGALWVYSLGTNFGSEETRLKAERDLEPFSALKANIVDGYKNISQEGMTGEEVAE